VAIVLADDAFARGGIVGLTDAGVEQELRIVERLGAKHDEIGRLLDLLSGAPIEINHAAHFLGLPIEDDLLDIGMSSKLEFPSEADIAPMSSRAKRFLAPASSQQTCCCPLRPVPDSSDASL
jgi:hypothetical protein